MKLFSFIIISLALVGPKFGMLDTSAIGGGLAGFYLFLTRNENIPRALIIFSALIAIILLHSAFTYVFFQGSDLQPVLRHTRALLATLLLGAFFFNSKLKPHEFSNIIILALLLNAGAVIAQILIPQIKPIMADVLGFTKNVNVSTRAFGLTAGYDTAGYLCVFGFIISTLCARATEGKYRYLAATVIFLLAGLLTSRTTMLLMTGATMVAVYLFLTSNSWRLKISATAVMTGFTLVLVLYIIPLFIATVGVLNDLGLTADDVVTAGFAAGSAKGILVDHMHLPEGFFSQLIGTGSIPKDSDVGYVRMTYMIGFVGLSVTLFVYSYLIILLRKRWTTGRPTLFIASKHMKALIYSTIIIIALFYIINIKALYFFTRGFHELIVIMGFYLIGVLSQQKYILPSGADLVALLGIKEEQSASSKSS